MKSGRCIFLFAPRTPSFLETTRPLGEKMALRTLEGQGKIILEITTANNGPALLGSGGDDFLHFTSVGVVVSKKSIYGVSEM